MEFTRDFQLVLAGGLISLITTIVVLIVITLLIQMDRRGENK